MREIKFRAWDKENKEWLEVEDPYDKRKVNVFSFYSDSGWEYDDFIFMQYTGLKDKNGVECYEGDIVKWACIKDGVKYHESIKELPTILDHHFYAMLDSSPIEEQEEFKVIGNIYENKELLDE